MIEEQELTEEELRFEDFRFTCGYVGRWGGPHPPFGDFIVEAQSLLNLDDRGLSLILGATLRSEVRGWREGQEPEKHIRKFVGWKVLEAFDKIHPPPPIEKTPPEGRVVVSDGPFPIVRRIFEPCWGQPLLSVQPISQPGRFSLEFRKDD